MPTSYAARAESSEPAAKTAAMFADALGERYAPHSVELGNGRAFAALHQKTLGPFEVDIARGRSLRWVRQNGALYERWHDQIFLIQQRGGKSVVFNRGKRSSMTSGDMVLVSPIGDASFEIESGSLLSFHLPISRDQLLGQGIQNLFGSSINGMRGFGRVLSSLVSTLREDDADFDGGTHNHLIDLILTLIEKSQFDNARDRSQSTKVAQLREWLAANLESEHITPDKMAAAINVSRRQLYRILADEGLSPQSWLWQIRLELARDLLVSRKSNTVTDAAFCTGFTNVSHFSRSFKTTFGYSPRSLL